LLCKPEPCFAASSRGYITDVKLVFAPIGIVAGLLAGAIAQKGFERIWATFDEEEPPDASQRNVRVPKLVAALLLEGAIFRLTKGLVDHGVRGGFARATGRWPGDEKAEPKSG
jgi:Protein of unknown function (DUF4235)